MLSGEFHTTYASDMGIFETRRAGWVLAAFIVALFAIPFVAGSYWLDVTNRAAIAVIAATGLNILTGFTGQISLGNAAFLAVGAYTTAFLANHGVPFLFACPLAGMVTALAGMVFGIPSLRLKGLYLAMATLAAHFIIEFTSSHWEGVTGGVAGTSVPSPRILGFDFSPTAASSSSSFRPASRTCTSPRTSSAPASARRSSPSATRTSPRK